ncbi:helix-turn-helix transcriptional regulator [Lysinibacillus sp. FSL K6-0232]|uniref:helix-turn-helix domain-containing protein n=1 Tax=Lysinibacillus sp. FSL K6-0232 TaxID=2921425 RepID=UPI0030F9FF6A
MSLVNRIKNLCDEKSTNFAEVERRIGISNGQIRRWDNSSPKAENLERVADHFNVSTDYLLGRSGQKNYFTLEANDKSDADKKLLEILNELDEEDKELLIASLENSLLLAKQLAKKKFH